MEKLWSLVVALSTCAALKQDLSGKVFIFPQETNTDHVKLLTPKDRFAAITTCLRFVSDQNRPYSLFSLTTPTRSHSIVIYMPEKNVFDSNSSYPGSPWHSLCVSWEFDSGMSQLWLDGKTSVKKFIKSGTPISGQPTTILGQEQESHGGGFMTAKSFVGMISDLHVWDSVLGLIDVQRYTNYKHFTPGNVFSWRSLDYELIGKIFVEDDPQNLPW